MIWEIEDGPRVIEGLDQRGRARPEYAAGLGLVPAPVGRRMLATVIEAVAVGLLTLPLLLVGLPAVLAAAGRPAPVDALFGRDDAVWVVVCIVVPYALTTIFLLIQLILLGRRGVTLGKAMTGIRAVNVKTLERPTFWRGAVVRYLVQVASLLLPLIGPLLVVALSPLFDPDRRRRGWPDLAAGTWVVDIRHGLNPYDAKRMRIARKTLATDLHDEKASLPSLATPASGPATGVYVPVARNRGGVLGAPRERTAGDTDRSEESPAAPIQASPFAGAAPAAPEPSREPFVVAEPAAPVASPSPQPAQPAPASAPDVAPAPAAAPASTSGPAAAAAPAETLLPDATGAGSGWSPPDLSLAPVAAASLLLDTGETFSVGAAGAVLGRAPSVAGADAGAAALAIADTTMSMSKTHLALRWQGGVLVAVDLGSTNGSALVRGGVETPLDPGAPVAVRADDTLRLGDRHASVRLP